MNPIKLRFNNILLQDSIQTSMDANDSSKDRNPTTGGVVALDKDREWSRSFGLLSAFNEKHGHTYVPVKDEDGTPSKFGNWVSIQRSFYKRYEDGEISYSEVLDRRFACLESVGGFERDSKWKKTLAEFKAHMVIKGGIARILTQDVEKGNQLLNWFTHQKVFYRKYKAGKVYTRNKVFDERTKCLEELVEGFGEDDSLNFSNEVKWENMFHELEKYKEKHGHILVPHQSAEHCKLSFWVHRQKQFYKAFETDKTRWIENHHINYEERFRRLQALGGYSDKNLRKLKRYSWEQMNQQLIRYKRKYGSVDVVKNDAVEDAFPMLEGWVRKQRKKYTKYKAGKSNISKLREMHDKRLNCLETIGLIPSQPHREDDNDTKASTTIIADVPQSFCPEEEDTNNDEDLSSIFSDDSIFPSDNDEDDESFEDGKMPIKTENVC